jgi:uncharacterized repeat protein (TIGR01451 family)
MNHSLPICLAGKQGYPTAISFGDTSKKRIHLFPFFILFGLLLTPLLGWFGDPSGALYGQCSTSAPTVLAKWDFNSLTTQCNGAVSKGTGTLTSPFLSQGQNTYCPNLNNGCGAALLGTKGFGNTNDFKNAICLAGFWRNDGGLYASAPGWNANDVVFHPEIPANLNVSYVLPAGKAGSITSFSLQVIQKQFDGTNPAFEKQGVGVYRNGVLIYSQTQSISTSTVNGTALTFTFPNSPEFTSDGSAAVNFEIVFGLVHRLIKISTGYDNICVIGTCGSAGSPNPTASISPATCSTGSANSDGKLTLSNFGAADHYDINFGNSYTGVQTYATSTVIPAGGVISSTLPNPATPQVYSVRVFTSAGCTTDLQVTLNPTICPGNCTAPTGAVAATGATCAGTSVNNNASIAITGVTGGDKVGISPGSFYTGPIYSSAKSLTASAYTFSALPNPNGSQAYTVRMFNGDDNCFKDYFITLNETSCGCKKIGVQITESDQADPDSSPNNSVSTEDDFASYEVCKGTQTIDLKLAKTVSPTSGSTCPTNTDFVWKMVLTNAGSMSATNIQVTDRMPADLLITSATVTSGTFTISGGWLIPSLSAGASTTLTITTKATKPGTYTNCAWVSGAFPLNDPNSSPLNDYTANEDDDDCASITVTGSRTPEVAKEFSPNTAKTNTPIRLTIKLTNNEATPITLTAAMVDNLPASPAQMTVAPTPNLTTSLPGVVATAGGTSITIPIGTVLAPGLNQLQVDVIASADGEYCNDILAGALQTTACNNVAGTEACVIVKSTYVMGPLIKKSFDPPLVGTGQSSTLVITIDNRNAGNMTVLQNFIDDLPSGLVIAGAVTGTYSGTGVIANASQVGLAAGALIPAGISTIHVPVQSSTAATYCNTIIENTLISAVSNGSVQVMTGNDGIATACLTVAPNPCTTIDVTSIIPFSPIVAPTGTVSLTVNGTGFGVSTLYTWKGTGAFNPQGISTTYTAPAATGTYTLTVVADNRLTGYGACKDSTTINVLVQDACSLAATVTASSQTVCQNQSVSLSALASPAGSYTYVWAAPVGITLTGANSATATAALPVAGLQTFTVTVSSSPGCSTTATVSVLVNAPTTLPTYQPTTLCEGGSLTFSISPPAGASAYWTTPANTTISSGTVTIASATTADGGTYTLYYTNANGCTSSTAKVVTVNAKPTLSLASIGCVSGNQSYTVLLSTNATSLTTNASQFGVTTSGNLLTVPVTVASFAVSASSAAGCVATLGISAPACTTVCVPPNAGSDQTFCAGPTTTTLVSSGVGEQWSVAQQVSGTSPVINQSGSPVTVSGLTLPGVYKFRLASASVNSCSAVVTITVNPVTVLPTFTSSTVCEGQGVSFGTSVAVGDAAYWTTPTNSTINSGTVIIASATSNDGGTYTLHYTNAGGCISLATQSVVVNARPTLSLVSSGCLSDGQSYTALLSTNASSLTTNASQLGVTTSGNLITAPITVTSFAVSALSAAGCVATLPITAPSCATACSMSAVVTVGTCATATNTYSATAVVTIKNPTAGGAVSISTGGQTLTFSTTAVSQNTFTATFNGLVSDGASHTVTASLPGCSSTTTPYTAPASCSVAPVCSISAVATPGLCSTATNTFSSTVLVTMANPTASILTVTDGVNSVTFAVPTTLGTVTTSAIFNGLVSNGTSHTVTASLAGCSTTTTTYAAPGSCSVAASLGSLSDFVWKDANNNGLQDANELGVAGITVDLYTVIGTVRSGTPIATTVTSASGLYGFVSLPSGQYQVKFTLPASLTGTCRISTKPNTGVDDAIDSDVDPTSGFSQVVTIDTTQPVSSTARNNSTVDMGLTNRPIATISDPCQCFDVEYYVTEKRELYETFEVQSSTGESWSVISQTGMLALDSLVKHPVLIGMLLTEKPAGSGKYQLSFTHENGVGYTVVVSNGEDTLSIGNVCTKYPAYATTVLSQTVCRTATPVALAATTGVPGTYEFFYIDKTTQQRVVITQFDPSLFATGDTVTIKMTITPTDPNLCRFTIVQDIFIGADCTIPPVGSISDFVWNDLNKNGRQDSGEPGVSGITVRLLKETTPGNYTVVSTTVTSGNGTYLFQNLSAGTYVVEFDKTTLPANFSLTVATASGVSGALDSDADPVTGRSGLIILNPTNPAQRDIVTIDAGIVNTDCSTPTKCVPIAIKRIR